MYTEYHKGKKAATHKDSVILTRQEFRERDIRSSRSSTKQTTRTTVF
jgi:hypothetical protein